MPPSDAKILTKIQLLKLCSLGLLLALTACGGGSSGTQGSTGLSAFTLTTAEPAGLNCAYGGSRIDAGLDANSNNKLDTNEISSTQYACHGNPGAAGVAGLANLVTMNVESAGGNCAAGGFKISVGLDANSNSILDTPEVTSSQFVCQGVNGMPGSNGTPGSNGINTLMAITTEAAGANCTYGGNKLTSGPDTNANNSLDTSEITATAYTCNGKPGLDIPWVSVTSTAVAAQPNVGYLTNNANLVTVTLPISPFIGDIVQVTGVGAGGWNIAQNEGQSVLTQGISGNVNPSGVYWTKRTSENRYWMAITSSKDGNKLAAVVNTGQIYTSTDSGITWIARETNRNWNSITSSSDGSKLAAVVNGGQIYTSTDSGITWTAQNSGNRAWMSIASSSDGNKLAAVVNGGQIYYSYDSGVTWNPSDSNRNWLSITSSSDGNKLAAVVYGGQIYTSTDSGFTWTARENNRDWFSIASSSDGKKLAAVDHFDLIYTSTDSGVSWTARASSRFWNSIASSSDGTKLAAVVNGGQIYTSSDSGVSWTVQDGNDGHSWQYVTSSGDGKKLAAVEFVGGIYTSLGGQTTIGTGGYISGGQYDAISLQYIGGGLWVPLSYTIYSSSGIVGF